MTVREYAKSVNFEIVGKLFRFPKAEVYGRQAHKQRAYIDEAGNEYYISKRGACIVTIDGKII